MVEKNLFDKMVRLTKQLKGAPLKPFEKENMWKEFERAHGSAYERAEKAVAKVMHAQPGYIHEKEELLDDVKHMVADIRRAAAAVDKKEPIK